MQPRLHPLPVIVRPARSERADDRRSHGRHRRAARHAGLLREHRRRRADDSLRLLRARRLRGRQRRRCEVLDQRFDDHARTRRAAGRRGLRGRADLHRRRDRGDQRRGARRGLVRDRAPGDGPSLGGRVRPVQDQRRRHAAQHGRSSTRSSHWQTATAHSCASRGCARRVAAPTRGTSCIRPRTSRSISTGGCRSIRTPSPATRSSTCPRSAIRCRDSTSAAPVVSCA